MNQVNTIVAAGILILITSSVLTTLISGSCFFWIFVILAMVVMLEIGGIMGRR